MKTSVPVTYVATALLVFSIVFVQSCRKDVLEETQDMAIKKSGLDAIKNELSALLGQDIQEWLDIERVADTIMKDKRLPDTLEYQHLDYFIQDISRSHYDNNFQTLLNLGLYPAWSLSEPAF